MFAGQKAKNVPDYADYVVAVLQGQDGMTPPIILYSEDGLEVEVDEYGKGFFQVPFDRRLVAIDGETQRACPV